MTAATIRPFVSWRSLAAVSLCLNVFLAAYLGSQLFGRAKPGAGAMPPPALISRVAGMLPDADARILWDAYGRSEPQITAAQKDYRQVLTDAAGLLRQPTVDEAALKQVVQQARDKRLVIGDMMIEVFLVAFPKMSLKGRETLLEKSLHSSGGSPEDRAMR
jgi:uncharacterized membrane protein